MSIKNKIIIIILVFAAFVAVGFYFGYQKNYFSWDKEKNSEPAQETIPPAEVSEPKTEKPPATEIKPPAPAIIKGYKLYKNMDFGFEIQYPDSWAVSEEDIVNVRGENTKGFFFKKPNSDLRFAILPKDGLSYGLPNNGISEDINISGYVGVQTKYITADGRRLLLVHPQINMFNWDQEIGRLDIESSVGDPVGDFAIFNKMLNSFKFSR